MDQRNVSDLAGQLDGSLQRPGDPEYDAARTIWNAMIDRRPALIARCKSATDVVASVRFAREHDMLVSVRGGGHNVAGNAVCDDGLMIDLTLMNDVAVDPKAGTVTAGGGCTLAAIDTASHAHGLAVPAGIVSATGVGGLALGGGVGWLVRKYGMTCDNLISAEVISADGKVLTARQNNDEDATPLPHWTFHDLRRTATTGMARLEVPPHIADAILNHKDGTISGVAAIYNQHAYLKDRRLGLRKWEKHVLKLISAA